MDANANREEFVQIRLWKDCINNCKFCYLKAHSDRKTSVDQKKRRLVSACDLLKNLNAQKIGLIGGEFFEGQLQGCEDEWFKFIGSLKNADSEIFITANLIHEQHLLNETIEALNKEVLVCTSYDEDGRFHTEVAKNNWWKNVNDLHEQGVRVFCNCIATQDFFEAAPQFPEWLGFSLVDPHISLEWLLEVDKENYHENLLRDCNFFNFPKRRTAINWFKKHPQATRNYANYSHNHSNIIYGFNEHDEVELELQERIEGEFFNNPVCKHPHISSCYSDCNKCMMCDAQKIAESFMS